VRDEGKSQKEGRPIFEDKEFIEINAPGDKTSQIFRIATEADKRRFPRHYEAFKSHGNEGVIGTPLREWQLITRSQAEELACSKIGTVEQLAGINDANMQQVGPYLALRQLARDWLAKAKADAPAVEMRAQLEKRDNEIETLKGIMKQMGDQIDLLKRQKH
jgi:hypothetical protein